MPEYIYLAPYPHSFISLIFIIIIIIIHINSFFFVPIQKWRLLLVSNYSKLHLLKTIFFKCSLLVGNKSHYHYYWFCLFFELFIWEVSVEKQINCSMHVKGFIKSISLPSWLMTVILSLDTDGMTPLSFSVLTVVKFIFQSYQLACLAWLNQKESFSPVSLDLQIN